MDLSSRVNVVFDAPLKMALSPAELNFLIQSVQLNLNYTDEKSEHFQFARVKQSLFIDGVVFSASVYCPKAQLELFGTNNEKLLKVEAKEIDITTKSFGNASAQTRISAFELLMHDRDINNKEAVMLYSTKTSAEKTESFTITMEHRPSTDHSQEENRTLIVIRDQMLVLRLNTILSVSHIIGLAMPNYDAMVHRPNKCKLL